jgi:Asp/Glu/hydantoin racemase
MPTLALLHTGPVVIAPINQLVRAALPGVRVVNLLDDSIVSEIERAGHMTDAVRERLNLMGRSAVAAGASAVMITCSSISELAAPVAEDAGIPVYKIDEAMAEMAVNSGSTVGVIATLPTTLEPTCGQIERKARDAGKSIVLHRELCRAAFDRLSAGDERGHDQLVLDAVEKLSKTCDVVVLAQASMARLKDQLARFTVPVLTSPELGVARLCQNLSSAGLLG